MFIRDSSGNPNQISKVFVRDAVGTPNEISKIYVRDASGTPILVFDNTATVFECVNCDVGVAYYYTIGTSVANSSYAFYTQPRFIPHTSCLGFPAASPDNNIGYLPPTQIDKSYWSRIGLDYDYITFNKPTEEKTYYYTTEQTFGACGGDSSCLGNWLNNITTTNDEHFQTGNRLYSKLLTAFDSTKNYPPIPGYIITDYKTTGKKSTVWSMANFIQADWSIHGTSVDVDGYFNVCGLGVLTAEGVYEPGAGVSIRNTNIYPMYDRVVWLDKNKIKVPSNYGTGWFCSELGSMCGQQPCLGLYGEFYISWAVNNCSNMYGGYGWQYFVYDNAPENAPWNYSSCNALDGDTSNNNDNQGWEDYAGSTTLGSTQTWCIPTTTGSDWCINFDCTLFFGGKQFEWSDYDFVSPYTWLLAKEKTNTSKVYPEVRPSADSNDCCVNCFYGPTESTVSLLDAIPDICRNVYQIPPINTLDPQNQKFAYLTEYGSDQDMEPSGGIANGVAFNTNQDPSTTISTARIKHILPAYVTLSNNLIGKIVKMKQDNTTIESFINSGPNGWEINSAEVSYFESPTYDGSNGTLNEDDFSIWKAISSFLGFNIKDAVDGFLEPLPQKYRTYISSTSFYYEENRFDPSAKLSSSLHPLLPEKGISSVTDAFSIGQYPLLWWNFNGFPTEKHTHYVVVDMEFESETACQSYLNGGMRQVQNPHNLKKMIKSIYFYPLHTISNELKNVLANDVSITPNIQKQVTYAFRHPIFENYMVSDALQNSPDVFTNTSNLDDVGGNGFIDYYANGSGTTPTADQGGTGGQWLTTSTLQETRQRLYKYFQFGVGDPKTMWHSCLNIPPVYTYSDFLSKYYAAGTLVT